MKNLILLFLFSSTVALAKNSNPTTPTSINAVTVYVNGAQVTRTAKIIVPSGTTEFTFDKLSPYIQENSIQISGLKATSILSINYGINYINKQDKTKQIEFLQNKVQELNEAIQFENNLIYGYDEELSIIKDNRSLGNANEIVNLEKLQQFAAYYRKRTTEIKNLIDISSKKKIDYTNQIREIKQQLSEFNVGDKIQTGEIKIKLNTNINTQLNLIIKYNVTNAGWFPVYDLKAEEINKPLLLNYKAHVYQNTGSSWNNIKLTLSTNDPNTNNIKPEVNPKYLNFISNYSNYSRNNTTKNYNFRYNPFIKTINGIITDESGNPMPGANILIKGTNNGTITDFDGKYSIKLSEGKEIEVSSLGYKNEVLPIHSSIINLNMEADINELDKAMIVGYGARKKTSNIKIRGISSINSKKKLLYILDGTIVSEDEVSNLNPESIEKTEVLKDAANTSIYGNRASNGVVLMTSKKNYTSSGDLINKGITNTRFEIKKHYNIPSDGDITVIEIDNYTVPATFSYFAAPVVNENVFLTAKIGDWLQYNLLPGEANIYFEGSYSGKTNINPHATTDSLTVSLGIDPNVVIKRKTINNYKKGTFIGNNKTINKAYEIALKNNKHSSINLILIDRIPVSQNKEIKVEDIEYSNANYDSKKGLLKWNINLESSQSSTFKFSYILKYPKNKKVNL